MDLEREEQRLQDYLKRKEQNEANILRIEGMIEKAQAKHKADTKGERDWRTVISNLEDAHRDAKAELIDTTKLIDRVAQRIERAKNGHSSDSGIEVEVLEPEPPTPKPPKTHEEKTEQAARVLASTSITNLNKVKLETLSLAQEYIDARKAEGPLTPYDAQIAARLEVAAQSERPNEPSESERREQKELRIAIDVLVQENFGLLTLEQVAILANTHAVLSRKISPEPDDQRILNEIAPPLQKLSRILTNLQSKMRKG